MSKENVLVNGMKKTSPALILAFIAILSVAAAATSFGWVIRFRFYFGLPPFDRSNSASVAMMDEKENFRIRPISDRYQLKFMSFISSTMNQEETEVILEGKHGEMPLMNRTEPRYGMGWVNPTKIRVFEAEYDVWYLQMWVRDERLYLNVRYQGEEYVIDKAFLIDDPDLAIVARELMVEAWHER